MVKVVKLNLNRVEVIIIGVIRWLSSEVKAVRNCYYKYKPELVAIGISPEFLEDLQSIMKGEADGMNITHYEEIYARRLATYGKVEVPPRTLEELLKLCAKDNVAVVAIDMPEYDYADTFCKHISTFQLIRHALLLRRLQRRRFKARTAEEFVEEWDGLITKLPGFRTLEHAREKYISNKIKNLASGGKYNKIVIVVDLERLRGIIDALKESS